MNRERKRLERLHGVRVGDSEMLTIKEDARRDTRAPSPVRTIRVRVAGLYEHFVLVVGPTGKRECFQWQEFEQIRRAREGHEINKRP